MTRFDARHTMGRERVWVWVCAVIVLAGLSACAPAVTPEALSSPYQVAVGAYYALLSGETDAAGARATVADALTADPTDDAVRMVLAQVELRDYSLTGSASARQRLIGQMMALDASLRSGVRVVDWVETRLYVTLGDFVMHEARWYRQLGHEPDLWRALLLYDVADAAYRHALTLTNDEPSPGLDRERDHAATAQLASRLALAVTIGDLTTAPAGKLAQLQATSLQLLELELGADGVAADSTAPPVRGAVVLDPQLHVLRAAAFTVLALDADARMDAACARPEDRGDLAAVFDEYIDRLWRAGRHAVLAAALGVEDEALLVLLLSSLRQDGNHSPECACTERAASGPALGP